MSVASQFADVLCWWPWEMRGLFGRRRSVLASEPDLILRIGRGGVTIQNGRAKPAFEPVSVEPEQAGATARRLLGRWRRGRPSVCVLVEPGRYLKRTLAGVRLPRSRHKAMALLDVQSQTPFSLDDVHVVIPDYDDAVPESVYFAIKKSVLAPVVDGLRTAGLRPTHLGMIDGDRIAVAESGSLAEVAGRPRGSVISAGALKLTTATLAAGLVLAVGLAHWRYAAAAAQIDTEIAAANEDVAGLRKLLAERDQRLAQIGAIREEKRASVPVIRILEEMARAIPSSTWLTEVSVNGDRVTFAGFSVSAATLIPLLEASPLFSAPTFMEPVVKAGNEAGERFSISMQVEQGDG